jgi:hypothetical protein
MVNDSKNIANINLLCFYNEYDYSSCFRISWYFFISSIKILKQNYWVVLIWWKNKKWSRN